MVQQKFDATLESITQAIQFVDEQLEAADCSLRSQMQIDVALDEILSNIVHYAYPGSTGSFTLELEIADGTASITFIDQGIPYNPLEKTDPDVTLSAEERDVGGLGIFLVKKSMDHMEYSHKDGCNVLTIRRSL